MSDLVIVESPAKAKTIKKYLGSGYEVVASMGHVRDLPKSRLSVDIKKNFAPKYEIIKGKEKLVDDLKSAAEKSEHIYLATDLTVRERQFLGILPIFSVYPQMKLTVWNSMKLQNPVLQTV